jgi:glycosyltransferase involved in cell wall biosynthesis
MISIVLPTYNGERFIKQSINSIINQTYKEWELIIVDDCSTDDTFNIVEKYGERDNRISVIHNEVNQKLPASLNIGFKKAKGDWFTWTSDDNVFMPDALEKMYKELMNDQSIDFVYSNYIVIDPDDFMLFEVITGPEEEIFLKNNIGACFLYKKELHQMLNGYDKKKFLVEDYDFWIRAYEKYKFKHIAKELYYYRIHNSSLTAERKESIRAATIRLLEEHYQSIPVNNVKLQHDVLFTIAQYYTKHKNYIKAFKYYWLDKKRG